MPFYNYKTGEYESGIPKDYHDVIPQDEETQKMFDDLVSQGRPELFAAIVVLERISRDDE